MVTIFRRANKGIKKKERTIISRYEENFRYLINVMYSKATARKLQKRFCFEYLYKIVREYEEVHGVRTAVEKRNFSYYYHRVLASIEEVFYTRAIAVVDAIIRAPDGKREF